MIGMRHAQRLPGRVVCPVVKDQPRPNAATRPPSLGHFPCKHHPRHFPVVVVLVMLHASSMETTNRWCKHIKLLRGEVCSLRFVAYDPKRTQEPHCKKICQSLVFVQVEGG